MNGAGEINEAASTAEVGGLDPREAARILEQTKKQARRQFDPQSALAAVVGAGVFLFGYGAVWWSMHDQHVYSGPASWSLVVLYGLIAVSAIVGGVVSSRANAGVSGRARRQRQAQLQYQDREYRRRELPHDSEPPQPSERRQHGLRLVYRRDKRREAGPSGNLDHSVLSY